MEKYKITERRPYMCEADDKIRAMRIQTHLAMDTFLHDTLCIRLGLELAFIYREFQCRKPPLNFKICLE